MPRAFGLVKPWKCCLVILATGGVDDRCSGIFGLDMGGLFGRWPEVSGLSAGGVPGLLA